MNSHDMVTAMAAQMHAEMSANTFKGDRWTDADRELLEDELLYHVVKLVAAGRSGDIAALNEHAADVANCAGMLADKLGGLRAAQPGNLSAYGALPAPDYMHQLGKKMLELLR